MFSGYARLLLRLFLVLAAMWLVMKARVFVLVLAWAVIFACMWILWVKTYSDNKKLKAKLDAGFVAFTKTRFHKAMVALGKKLKAESKGKKSGK